MIPLYAQSAAVTINLLALIQTTSGSAMVIHGTKIQSLIVTINQMDSSREWMYGMEIMNPLCKDKEIQDLLGLLESLEQRDFEDLMAAQGQLALLGQLDLEVIMERKGPQALLEQRDFEDLMAALELLEPLEQLAFEVTTAALELQVRLGSLGLLV